jgi:hypothetical protein
MPWSKTLISAHLIGCAPFLGLYSRSLWRPPCQRKPRRQPPNVLGGAGGWGDPAERDPARIAHDVAEGKFSAEYVRREYGITVDDTGAELMTATAPAS